MLRFFIFTATLLGLVFLAEYIVGENNIPLAQHLDSRFSEPVPPVLQLDDLLKESEIKIGDPIFIRIFKESSELELWAMADEKYQLVKTYPICSFSGHLGPKLKEGDRQSPEGFYAVSASSLNPNSSYHLSFNLGFPNAYDRAHERTGSYLMVHGDCVSIGCYAMTDEGIDEIYSMAEAALENGQSFFRVHIFPFRMKQENMKSHESSPWFEFWENLKQGYDYFEAHKLPPNVEVRDKKYVFEDDVG